MSRTPLEGETAEIFPTTRSASASVRSASRPVHTLAWVMSTDGGAAGAGHGWPEASVTSACSGRDDGLQQGMRRAKRIYHGWKDGHSCFRCYCFPMFVAVSLSTRVTRKYPSTSSTPATTRKRENSLCLLAASCTRCVCCSSGAKHGGGGDSGGATDRTVRCNVTIIIASSPHQLDAWRDCRSPLLLRLSQDGRGCRCASC